MSKISVLLSCLMMMCFLCGCEAEGPSQVLFADNRPLYSNEVYSLTNKFTIEGQLEALTTANPTNDAYLYFKRGDTRFVGVNSHNFPDFPMSHELPYFLAKGFHSPEGTKLIFGSSDEELRKAARIYAHKYNDHIWMLLGK